MCRHLEEIKKYTSMLVQGEDRLLLERNKDKSTIEWDCIPWDNEESIAFVDCCIMNLFTEENCKNNP